MINFILCKNNNYRPDDTKILQFILSRLLDEIKEFINKSSQKKLVVLDNSCIKARKMTTI